MITDRVKQRFWAKVNKTDSCWLWTACLDSSGYGMLMITDLANGIRRILRSHRISWIIENGEIPDDKRVLHKCDTPACVRPEHLFLGTQADNVSDMVAKKRNRPAPQPGEINPQARLTIDKVIAIRRLALSGEKTLNQIADAYGISFGHVSDIKLGRRWKHLW